VQARYASNIGITIMRSDMTRAYTES